MASSSSSSGRTSVSARAFTSHLDATPLGTWCGSRAFRELLQKLRAGKNEQECERARALTDARPEELDDDAMMMLQTMRFVCEQPQGRCHDYARKVFTSRMQGLEVERGALKSWRVTKELPGEGAEQVVLYVDLEYEKTGKKRAVMTMRQTPLGWRVSNEPGEL